MSNKPEWIVLHTSATGTAAKNIDISAAQIDKYHRNGRGFTMIGYHYLIRHDGSVEIGRKEDQIGAQCLGLNSKSLGICFSGHGDFHTWTPEQHDSGMTLVRKLMLKHKIGAANVIGHREVNKLVDAGLLANKFRTSKSCPGHKIDMDIVRDELSDDPVNELSDEEQAWGEKLYEAMITLYTFNSTVPDLGNFVEDLNKLRQHPRVAEIIDAYKISMGME